MRLCLVSQEYPPETARGGIGTQAAAKARGLAARGHAVTVVSHSPTGWRTDVTEDGVRVVRVPFDERLAATEPAQWLARSWAVASELAAWPAAEAPDLIEFAEYGAEGFIYLMNRPDTRREVDRGSPPDPVRDSEAPRPAVAIQLHGPLAMFSATMGWPAPGSEFARVGAMMEAACVRRAEGVYSSSRCSADWCAREYGRAGDIPVLHTGVDTERFAPRPRSAGQRSAEERLAGGRPAGERPAGARPTVLFVGRIVRNKGVEPLLEAVLGLRAEVPGARLRVVGTGESPLIERLRHRAAQAGAPEALELAGYVPRDQLPEEYAAADVFAAPSVYEGGPGFVYLEAMACGVPVIGCAGSGASEVIRDGATGLLVPPSDVDALRDALRQLLTDDALRQRMGAAARRYAVEDADTRRCLDRLEAFYADLIACTEAAR
jgi:glycosyltransferase involved in cell wall biosynthesis